MQIVTLFIPGRTRREAGRFEARAEGFEGVSLAYDPQLTFMGNHWRAMGWICEDNRLPLDQWEIASGFSRDAFAPVVFTRP